MKVIDIIRIILDIGLLIFSIYLYVENKKLKGFKIEKEIKLKEAEIENLNKQQFREARFLHNKKRMERMGISYPATAEQELETLQDKYNYELKKLVAEKEYLEKLKLNKK